MGVGVAGLQAIATARRLGARRLRDRRTAATKEQVEWLGATFLAVEDEEFKNAQTAGCPCRKPNPAGTWGRIAKLVPSYERSLQPGLVGAGLVVPVAGLVGSLYRLHNGVNRVYSDKVRRLPGQAVFLHGGVIRLNHLIRRNRWSNAARPRCGG